MDAAWSGDEAPLVGIVNSETATGIGTELVADVADDSGARSIRTEDALESVLEAHDATTVRGGLEEVLASEPSLLVTAGERDLAAVARAGSGVPVLPVGEVPGIESVDRERLPGALAAALEGAATVRRHPVLGIEVETEGADEGETETRAAGGERRRERALFDVTLVTDEPARISEYGVASRDESVATVRADGVVVATPAGTHGYAAAVDAPHLSPAVDAVAVAPIAPFVTQTRRWVLPDDDLELTVERDEGDVTLVADGRPAGPVTVDARVAVSVDGLLETLAVPADRLES